MIKTTNLIIFTTFKCDYHNIQFLNLETVERLRLRLQICQNIKPLSIWLNFGLIVYFIETQIQQPKIIKTCV